MPIAVNGMDGNPWTTRDMDASGNNKITTYHLLAFTGSYTTTVGGDTVDLTSIMAQIPTPSLPDQITWESNGPSTSFCGGGGYLQFAKGATINANKMKVFAAGGSEQGSGSYSSIGLTTDVITLTITWKKLVGQP